MTAPRVPGCTGKHKYATEELAQGVCQHRDRRKDRTLYPYHCRACGCWHITGQSPEEHQRRTRAMYAHRARVGARERARERRA